MALTKRIEEVEPVAVDADACPVEIGTVFITILTSTVRVNIIAFHALNTLSSGTVVRCTILIL